MANFCEKIPSMNIVEIAKAVSLDARHDIIGIGLVKNCMSR